MMFDFIYFPAARITLFTAVTYVLSILTYVQSIKKFKFLTQDLLFCVSWYENSSRK